MADTQNETLQPEQEPAPRGGYALIGRFLAVGLFVALGTFAVIQSLSGSSEPSSDDKVITQTGDENPPEDLVGNLINKVKQTASSTPTLDDIENKTGEFVSNGASKAKSALDSVKNKLTAPPIKPPAQKFTASKPPTTRQTPVTLPAPKTAPPTSGPPVVIAGGINAPAPRKSPPPDRFAALPQTGPPGFTPPARKTAAPPTQNPFGPTVNQIKKDTGSFLGNAANKTSGVINQAKQGANGITDRARNAFSLGGQDKPQAPPTGRIQTIEAKPRIDSLNNKPFAPAPSNAGRSSNFGDTRSTPKDAGPFRSQSLNPISRSTAPPTGRSSTRPQASTFPPAKTPPARPTSNPLARPSNPISRPQSNPLARPSNPISRPQSNPLARSSRPSTGPPRNDRTPARPASSRSIVRSGIASSVPGDRKYDGAQAPSIMIEKRCPREVQVNQTADFEFRIRNVGRVTAEGVQVVDKVPSGSQFIGATPKPSVANASGDLQWEIGSLRPGEEKTIRYQLKPIEPGEIGSVAQVLFSTRASMRTLVTRPELKIRHSTESTYLVGDNVIFDVVVENAGNGPARDVIVQEQVPELLEYQDGSREIEYEIGTLMPGQTRRVQLGLKAARVGKLRNVMFASAQGGLQAKHETNLEIVAPKLNTASSGPTHRYLQRQATHQFTVSNSGTAKATNVQLIARLPSGLRFVSADNRGRYNPGAHAVTWVMPTLNPGVTGNVEVTTVPVESGDQGIKFEAIADLNQKSETDQALNVEHLVDVFFTIDDVIDPIEIGAETRYRIRVVNQGTQAASNVQLQVDFPQGIAPSTVDGSLRNEIRGQRVIFEPISSLRPGEELTVNIAAIGKTDGDHRVAVNMRADGRQTPVTKEETTRVYRDR